MEIAEERPYYTPGTIRFCNSFAVPAPEIPTQHGELGIRYDFCEGARLLLPNGKWHVRIEDSDSGNVLYDGDSAGGLVSSRQKYYINAKIRVWQKGNDSEILNHKMDLKDRPVQIHFPFGALGDNIAWMSAAVRFVRKHGCKAEFLIGKDLADLFASQYPDIIFTDICSEKYHFSSPYALYRMGFFQKENTHWGVFHPKTIGLHHNAAYILDVDNTEEPPKVFLGSKRLIKERYVCIASKASSAAKLWNNSSGWQETINYLKNIGYRVLCIDKDRFTGFGYGLYGLLKNSKVWYCYGSRKWRYTFNDVPEGAEDFTGNLPLQERVSLLEHADFFIGLSSGLAWLAWCTKIPIIMISGFTMPTNEFYTPYRIYPRIGCKGCWNDPYVDFSVYDYMECPQHKGTEREFECSRNITGKQVIGQIKRLMREKGLSRPDGK